MPHEDDIRAAFRALAERAPDADGVLATITAPQPWQKVARDRHRRRTRLLAPVSAAAAVVAVIAALAVVGGGNQNPQTAAAAGYPHLGNGLPRYYMALVADGGLVYQASPQSPDPATAPRDHAVIRDAETGTIVATLKPPSPLNSFFAIAGAADDTTFVLASVRDVTTGHGDHSYTRATGDTRLFLARLNPATAAVRLTAVPLTNVPPADLRPTGLALSADGSQIAVAYSGRDFGRTVTSIQVYSVRTTGMKLWQATGINYVVVDTYQPYAISWGHGGQLGFSWPAPRGRGMEVRILDTGTAGGNLVADSRAVALREPHGLFYGSGDAMLSPAGDLVVVPTAGQHGLTEFGEYSAATGALVRLLWPVVQGRGFWPAIVLWANGSGTVLAVYTAVPKGSSPAGTCGVIRGSRFTPIPGCPLASTNAWWAPMTF
jgi:hypothetical protein